MVIDFNALIDILRKEQSHGNMHPLRSKIGQSLAEHSKEVYQVASSFGEYATWAQRMGIVQMGGKDGHAWISLNPDFNGKQHEQQLSQPEAEPAIQSGCATTRCPPSEFAILVELLMKEHLRGNTHASRSVISIALLQRDKRAYEKAGVKKFSEYSALAVKAGVAQMGGWEGTAWIALHPYWQRTLCGEHVPQKTT
jgi:hypothetical protein